MTIIGSTESTIVSNGNTYADFESIKTGLKAVAQLNSLIAFFREAIKEKEELAKQAQSYTDQIEDWKVLYCTEKFEGRLILKD